MLERSDYRLLHKVFAIVTALIHRSTEYKKTKPMNRINTYYGEIVAGVTGDIEQPAWGGEAPGSL